MNAFRAACVQLRSSDDVAQNIAAACELIREAKSKGAQFIATPENTTLSCFRCNTLKRDASFEELLALVENMRRNQA